MNLIGKYIEINIINFKSVLNYLHNENYIWGDNYVYYSKESIDEITKYVKNNTKHNKKTLIKFKETSFLFSSNVRDIEDFEYLNINIFLREEKLKRILKSNDY